MTYLGLSGFGSEGLFGEFFWYVVVCVNFDQAWLDGTFSHYFHNTLDRLEVGEFQFASYVDIRCLTECVDGVY